MFSMTSNTKSLQNTSLKPDGFRVGVISLILSTLSINILSLALPIMTLQVYDRILPNPGTGTLPVLIFGVCLAVFLEAALRLSRAYIIGRSGSTYEHMMACKAIKCIINADFSRIGPYGIGEHMSRIGSIGKLKDFYNGYFLSTIAELAFVPVFMGLIIYISGALSLVPAAILLLFTLISAIKGHELRAALNNREKEDEKRFTFLIESLEGTHTLKAFSLEKFFERRYEALEERSCAENYNVTQETSGIFNMGAIFSHLMVASVISAGAILVLQGNLTTGALIATLLLSGRMMQPVQKTLSLWAKYQDYTLARRKIEDLFSTPQKIVHPRSNNREFIPDGRLEIKNVSFQHNENTPPILKNINLSINRGEVILLSGPHGSGKSTLLNIIAGIYTATEGEIFVDGEDINTYPSESLPRHVGYIRTRNLIFRGTIRENITCFGQTDEAQAREVASFLGVDKDVAKLPGGFDTFLSGSNADTIPRGLKQRIAIVRVLATKPKLIIFDNADRSLDRDGYAMMYSLMARLKGKASMILVSEDHNIISLATRSYSLVDGELRENGDVLSKTNIRPYREMRL